MKQAAGVGNLVGNFAATLKSMTPMPKLAHTFSQPVRNGKAFKYESRGPLTKQE